MHYWPFPQAGHTICVKTLRCLATILVRLFRSLALLFYPPVSLHSTAYDFTGQWSEVTSPGVTVDATPPTCGSIWLEGVTSANDIRAFWDPVEEYESELAGVEWAVGSRRGASDLVPWTEVTANEISGTAITGLDWLDGQLVFVSLMVRCCKLYHTL